MDLNASTGTLYLFVVCVQLPQTFLWHQPCSMLKASFSSHTLLTVNYPLGIFYCCTVGQVHEVILIQRCIAPWVYSSRGVGFNCRVLSCSSSSLSRIIVCHFWSFWARCINQLSVSFWVLDILIQSSSKAIKWTETVCLQPRVQVDCLSRYPPHWYVMIDF